jgi:hypothetical protein
MQGRKHPVLSALPREKKMCPRRNRIRSVRWSCLIFSATAHKAYFDNLFYHTNAKSISYFSKMLFVWTLVQFVPPPFCCKNHTILPHFGVVPLRDHARPSGDQRNDIDPALAIRTRSPSPADWLSPASASLTLSRLPAAEFSGGP